MATYFLQRGSPKVPPPLIMHWVHNHVVSMEGRRERVFMKIVRKLVIEDSVGMPTLRSICISS